MVFQQEGGIHAASREKSLRKLSAAKRDPVLVAQLRDAPSPGMVNAAAASGEEQAHRGLCQLNRCSSQSGRCCQVQALHPEASSGLVGQRWGQQCQDPTQAFCPEGDASS